MTVSKKVYGTFWQDLTSNLEKVIQTCASIFSLYFTAKIGKRKHMAKKIVQQIVKCTIYKNKQ